MLPTAEINFLREKILEGKIFLGSRETSVMLSSVSRAARRAERETNIRDVKIFWFYGISPICFALMTIRTILSFSETSQHVMGQKI